VVVSPQLIVALNAVGRPPGSLNVATTPENGRPAVACTLRPLADRSATRASDVPRARTPPASATVTVTRYAPSAVNVCEPTTSKWPGRTRRIVPGGGVDIRASPHWSVARKSAATRPRSRVSKEATTPESTIPGTAERSFVFRVRGASPTRADDRVVLVEAPPA